jgi:hypothetical protein
MKKSDIIKRITDIVSDNPNKRIDLIQFNIELESYKYVLYKTERGSIHIMSYPTQNSHSIRDLSTYILSNILYEIGNEDDMKAVKKDVNPTVYALCLNRLNKSV